MYKIVFTKQAVKDIEDLKRDGLADKARLLIGIIKENPFCMQPPYEKLVGNLSGLYSRRINIQHRLVYEVCEQEQTVKIIRMRTHYQHI